MLIAALSCAQPARAQVASRTLVAVWAHADDETPVGPVLARYAREGSRVYMIVVTDGSQGGANTSVPRGPELAKVRAQEATCSAQALGIHPPILLGFPDGALGHYTADRGLLFGLTQQVQAELQRLRPDALITWGPDGGTGHPDHRLVSNVVTQLVRAGAPGVPERLFYASIPVQGFTAINPGRGAPPFMVPQPKYLSTRVSVSPADLEAGRRSMECHKTQYSAEVVERVSSSMRDLLKGQVALSSLLPTSDSTDLFR
jgi:LmbE family N-acetylglucosaminyl deacetylase